MSVVSTAHIAFDTLNSLAGLFLLVVLVGSAIDGNALGLTLAGSAFFLFDFLFLPPYCTLGLTNPLDWPLVVPSPVKT